MKQKYDVSFSEFKKPESDFDDLDYQPGLQKLSI